MIMDERIRFKQRLEMYKAGLILERDLKYFFLLEREGLIDGKPAEKKQLSELDKELEKWI